MFIFCTATSPPAISSQSTSSSSEEGTPSPKEIPSLPGTSPKSFSASNIVLKSNDSCSKALGSIVESVVDEFTGLFFSVVGLGCSGSFTEVMSVVVFFGLSTRGR